MAASRDLPVPFVTSEVISVGKQLSGRSGHWFHDRRCMGAWQVDDSGKVQRLRKVCPAPTCGPGTFMATHFNRVYWCVLSRVASGPT